MRRLRRGQARRVTLGAQGLARPRPTGRVDARHFRRAVADMALVQLDSVNVFQRSHRMPFFTRLGAFDTAALDRWLWRSGELVEAWCHVASLVPLAEYPRLGWRRRDREPWDGVRQMFEERPGYVQAVLQEITANGPTTVSDLNDRGERTGPWWGNPPGKLALDWLHHSGRLAIVDRTTNFVPAYDLVERVVPDEHRHDDLPAREAIRAQLLVAARSLGVGTAADLADVHRLGLRPARDHGVPPTRQLLAELAAEGALEEVAVDGWGEPAYLHPEATVPRRVDGRALLTPFDPVVWFRPRLERLFDFHYRIEIYTPAPKRVYGYYVLPFLLGDELVGRADLRHDRAANVLEVPSAFAEPGQDPVRVARALADELRLAASWVGADEIALGDRGDLVGPLRTALG